MQLQCVISRPALRLGLLRHGRLFGHFENGQTDCVGGLREEFVFCETRAPVCVPLLTIVIILFLLAEKT